MAVVGPKDPPRTLRVYASRLRRILSDEVGPHVGVGGYKVEVEPDEVDAQRFEELSAAAASRLVDDPAGAASRLRAALQLWRGPALAEFREEPWAVGPAVRLEELRLVALEQLADARLALGEHGDLCEELEQLQTTTRSVSVRGHS